ncbi:Protein kinase domain, partial [Rhizoctonia solani]
MSEPPPPERSIEDPAGAWPMDKNLTELSGLQPLFVSSERSFGILHNTYFVKLVPGRSSLVAHELRMMLLAEDCSVIPLGRVFDRGTICGFITPREKTITESAGQFGTQTICPQLTRQERLELIAETCLLVSYTHSKGLIHGDIKPSNILRCSDGSLRFCDFAEATKKGSSMLPRGFTPQYAAPALLKGNPRPLTVAEDLYSLGITIWEIYTGQIPFAGVDEDTLEDLIRSGGQPDMSLIDDANILALITTSLEATDKQLDPCFGHYVSDVGSVQDTKEGAHVRPQAA